MWTKVARVSRQALAYSLPPHRHLLLGRSLATEAAAPKLITPSADRVKLDYRGQRQIIPLGQWLPKVAVDAYVAPNVVLASVGLERVGPSWRSQQDHGRILLQLSRAMRHSRRVELPYSTKSSNSDLKSNSPPSHLISAKKEGLPAETSIERFVTIGANCLLRSVTIEPECIIGQHSILIEGSLVESHSILEAGSVIPPGRRIPTGELWAGNPARY